MTGPRLRMAPPPPPGGGKTPWSRTAGRLAFASLAAWSLAWMAFGLLGHAPGSADLLWLHVGLGGVGFAGNLVVGVGFRLDATFHERPLAPLWMQRTIAWALATGGWVLAAASWPEWPAPRTEWIPVSAFALAIAVAVMTMAAGRQSAQGYGIDTQYGATDKASDRLLPFALVYALLAAASALYQGMAHPSTVHLFLAGFVTMAIYVVAHRILPRFSTKTNPRLHNLQAWLAIPGPAFLAWGVGNPRHEWAVAGAALEFFAALTYAVLVGMAWRHGRTRQPALPLMFLAALLAVHGMLLGLAFLAHGWLRMFVVVHAVNNLVGFVALTVVGAGSAILGAGIRPVPGSAHRYVWLLGGAIAIPLMLWQPLLVADHPAQNILWLSVAALAAHALFGLKALGVALPLRG